MNYLYIITTYFYKYNNMLKKIAVRTTQGIIINNT